MARTKHSRYSEKTINEAIALYQSGEEVAEINRTYDLTPTTIYHFLKSRGIPARAKANGMVVSEPEVPGSHFTHGTVTVDKEGFVQNIQREKKKPTFELVFTGTIIIEADSLEEAISNARKRTIVNRIHSVREVQ